MRIDLHTHSNCSDGSLSPRRLLDLAKQYDVHVLALTDHDTIDGLQQASIYGREIGVQVVNGVELSIDYPLKNQAHLHLLGLFIDDSNKDLRQALQRLQQARERRGVEIIDKLRQIGLEISHNDLDEQAAGASVGRPHIAHLLVKKGYVNSVAQAFRNYLSKDKPAYVPKEKLKIEAAIDVVHRAGGLALLAHPISLGYDNYPRFGEEILKLQALGLDGIEAYYPSHDRYFTQWLLDFAAQHDLAVSGGSDFHGQAKPDIKPGVGFGNMNIPFSVYEELARRVTKNN